jgi:DNA-directed RNA polymerase subunit RPC12/RpoP
MAYHSGIETFTRDYADCPYCGQTNMDDGEGRYVCTECGRGFTPEPNEIGRNGWWWWSCLPGCLPDSDVLGPFKTEAEALEDAGQGIDNNEDDPESEAD